MYIYTAWKPTHHLKQATSTYSKLSGNWKKSYKGAPIYGLPPYPDSSAGKESTCNAGDPSSIPGSGRSAREGTGYSLQFLGFPYGSAGNESTCNAGELGLIPGLGKSPGEGKGYPLQCSGLENSVDCIVHGVTKSQTRVNNFYFPYSPPELPVNLHSWLQTPASGYNSIREFIRPSNELPHILHLLLLLYTITICCNYFFTLFFSTQLLTSHINSTECI